MKVSELARLSGVSVHRLRRYEALGLIHARRERSGYREFADSTVREVIFISMGRDLGFSLARIGEMLPRYRAGTLTTDQLVDEFKQRIAEVDAAIDAQRALRKTLVAHIAWLRKRQAQRRKGAASAARPAPRPAFPGAARGKR